MIQWNAPRLAALATAAVFAFTAAPAQARDQIRIVGSSTVYPFSSYVAEEFGNTTPFPTPVVEGTGSGGGHKLFGAGVALDTPDITNSSRRMKVSEFLRARDNGVDDITEAVIGFDGIAVAQSSGNAPVDFTLEQITLAVAKEVPRDGELVPNPYNKWSDIHPDLPDREILVYGPPSTSGTRDAFEELVMEVTTEAMSGYGGAYTKIRQDGRYVPSGENDNLIVKQLINDSNAFGIFGYSFLEENTDKLRGVTVNGVAPSPDAISTGAYPVSRSLYFYIKNAHFREVPGLTEYVELFMSEKMIGPDGYLKSIGLIPLPEERRQAARERVMERAALQLKLSSLENYMAGDE